jgi:multidrug resistance efflux pump
MPADKGSHVATEAFHILRTLYQLSTDLFASQSRQDLIFRILNSTIRLFAYRRAILWSFDNKRPRLLGVSGREDINNQSPLATLWRDVITSLEENKRVQVLNDTSTGPQDTWQRLVEKTSGFSVMWVPMIVEGELRAGLWLERWGKDVWDVGECEIMNAFAQNLSLAWKQFNRLSRWHNRKTSLLQRKVMAVAAVVIVYLLFFQTVSLRVVAPCEIVPEDPEMIAAPLEGVIKQVWVQPGDRVKKGELLFTYEDRIIMQELKVAQKQVEIIESQYDRIQLRAFQDDEAMEKIQSLKYRLEQEEIRLKLAESNAGHLEVRAPADGICMLDNPEYWQGRPVQIGERVVQIFLPEKSKVRIFLPENDYIKFDREKPVRIVMNSDPGSKYEARLDYVAPQTSRNPEGGASFIAEASVATPDARIRVGSKGSAIVYGEEVPTGYWLARKPLGGIRHLLGI